MIEVCRAGPRVGDEKILVVDDFSTRRRIVINVLRGDESLKETPFLMGGRRGAQAG
jgi:hypothetical protein